MFASEPGPVQHSGFDILIAIIGVVGGIVTAVVSNWDKLFHNTVTAQYSGYKPTGVFETELEYFFIVSGSRKTMESLQQQMLQNEKLTLLSTNPEDAESINEYFDAIAKEAIGFEDVFREILPVYAKYFTLSEIQELNKFYSTEIMQGMLAKMPLVTQDLAPLNVKLITEYLERLHERLRINNESET